MIMIRSGATPLSSRMYFPDRKQNKSTMNMLHQIVAIKIEKSENTICYLKTITPAIPHVPRSRST